MDYSQLSDFEINVAVFEAIHNGSPDYKEGENGAMVFVSFEGDIVNGDAVEVEVERGSFNPCANPADAWPIMTEKRIAIIPDTAAGEWVAFNEFTLYEGDWMFASDPAHHSNGKNPLRCAMETFLMMQEIQHA
ncbi:phage protein NinX family protein [Cronobacter dublinensis]